MQSENETVVKFGCRALFEVCLDDNNRAGMTAAGAGECLVALLKIHAPNIPVAQVGSYMYHTPLAPCLPGPSSVTPVATPWPCSCSPFCPAS